LSHVQTMTLLWMGYLWFSTRSSLRLSYWFLTWLTLWLRRWTGTFLQSLKDVCWITRLYVLEIGALEEIPLHFPHLLHLNRCLKE
jgi:hypothetical protein